MQECVCVDKTKQMCLLREKKETLDSNTSIVLFCFVLFFLRKTLI